MIETVMIGTEYIALLDLLHYLPDSFRFVGAVDGKFLLGGVSVVEDEKGWF